MFRACMLKKMQGKISSTDGSGFVRPGDVWIRSTGDCTEASGIVLDSLRGDSFQRIGGRPQKGGGSSSRGIGRVREGGALRASWAPFLSRLCFVLRPHAARGSLHGVGGQIRLKGPFLTREREEGPFM